VHSRTPPSTPARSIGSALRPSCPPLSRLFPFGFPGPILSLSSLGLAEKGATPRLAGLFCHEMFAKSSRSILAIALCGAAELVGSLPWDVVSLWGRGIVDGVVYEALGAIIQRKIMKQTRCCSLGECMCQMRDGAASLSACTCSTEIHSGNYVVF